MKSRYLPVLTLLFLGGCAVMEDGYLAEESASEDMALHELAYEPEEAFASYSGDLFADDQLDDDGLGTQAVCTADCGALSDVSCSATSCYAVNRDCGSGQRGYVECNGVRTYCDICYPSSVAAGHYHTVALTSDGTVWAWGKHSQGQLGDGSIASNHETPVQAVGLSSVTTITAGAYHTVALRSDGTVWIWGWNSDGQLGDGTTSNRRTPMQVAGLSGITAIAGGFSHTVALKSNGTVWTWGDNSQGQLGDGTTTDRRTPVQVVGLSGVTAIAAGNDHTLARKSDGTLWAWGRNSAGQLGDGTITYRKTPVQVVGLSSVTAVAAGFAHTIALKSNGTVWAWGDNFHGQLGDGTSTDRRTPVQAIGLSSITAIAAGTDFGLALKSDNTVWGWGENYDGQLGNGTTSYRQSTPGQMTGLSSITDIAAGFRHTAALKSDGTVWATGDNFEGQLGDGTRTDRLTPVQSLF